MKWDVTIFYMDEFKLDELIGDEIPEKYIVNEREELTGTSANFYAEKTVSQLLNFLFQGKDSAKELYRDNFKYILDLSSLRERLIDFDYLEQFFQKWIEETGRIHNMDEYGMLLDFIGHSKKSMDKKYLLLVVSIILGDDEEVLVRLKE